MAMKVGYVRSLQRAAAKNWQAEYDAREKELDGRIETIKHQLLAISSRVASGEIFAAIEWAVGLSGSVALLLKELGFLHTLTNRRPDGRI